MTRRRVDGKAGTKPPGLGQAGVGVRSTDLAVSANWEVRSKEVLGLLERALG